VKGKKNNEMKQSKNIKKVMALVIAFTFHLSPFTLQAQQPWNYSSLQEAHFDNAYFF
jgi:hypothetical protein